MGRKRSYGIEMQCKIITGINHDFRVFTMPLFLFVETRIECKITHHLLSISFTVAGARTICRLFMCCSFKIYLCKSNDCSRRERCTIASKLDIARESVQTFFFFFFLSFSMTSNWQLFETPTCLD